MERPFHTKPKILIVGTGFSGAVIADQLARTNQFEIEIRDERTHIGGNCHTERDDETGVMVHKYGPHIFHTSNAGVWNYVNSFVPFRPFVNRVKSIYRGNVYSLPVNLHTINQFFSKSMNPTEAKSFIEKKGDTSILDPQSFEEQALKFVGRELYEAFFYGYTKKQWGTEPKNLPASILKRLPIRFNYDDNYYNDVYQGIPELGYTEIIRKMLDHPCIKISLNTKYSYLQKDIDRFHHIFYTGPIDEFFDFKYGRLGYRTVTFIRKQAEGDFQGNAVINYADEDIPFTRIHEHKHFAAWETHEKTVYFEEYSKETEIGDIPYYPKRLPTDMEILSKYQKEILGLNRITFLGRLATYRYLDMHQIIEEALVISAEFLKNEKR